MQTRWGSSSALRRQYPSKTTFGVHAATVRARSGRHRGRAQVPITSSGSWRCAMSDQPSTTWPEASARPTTASAVDGLRTGGSVVAFLVLATGLVAIGGLLVIPPSSSAYWLAAAPAFLVLAYFALEGPDVEPGRDHRLGRLRAQQLLHLGRWTRPARDRLLLRPARVVGVRPSGARRTARLPGRAADARALAAPDRVLPVPPVGGGDRDPGGGRLLAPPGCDLQPRVAGSVRDPHGQGRQLHPRCAGARHDRSGGSVGGDQHRAGQARRATQRRQHPELHRHARSADPRPRTARTGAAPPWPALGHGDRRLGRAVDDPVARLHCRGGDRPRRLRRAQGVPRPGQGEVRPADPVPNPDHAGGRPHRGGVPPSDEPPGRGRLRRQHHRPPPRARRRRPAPLRAGTDHRGRLAQHAGPHRLGELARRAAQRMGQRREPRLLPPRPYRRQLAQQLRADAGRNRPGGIPGVPRRVRLPRHRGHARDADGEQEPDALPLHAAPRSSWSWSSCCG